MREYIKSINLTIVEKDEEKLNRLIRILKRDSDAIKAYLGIIKCEFDNISKINERTKKTMVDKGALDLLTLTTVHGKNPRTIVAHDVKSQFPRISHQELTECRDTAVGMYHGFLEQKEVQSNAKLIVDQPGKIQVTKLVPRNMNVIRSFRLEGYLLTIKDSVDTNWKLVNGQSKKPHHNWLSLKVQLSNYSRDYLKKGEIRSLTITRKDGGYVANISLKFRVKRRVPRLGRKKAVLGIDLGVNRTAVTTLITPSGRVKLPNREFTDPKVLESLRRVEKHKASLQKKLAIRKNNHSKEGDLYKRLKKYSDRVQNIKLNYIRHLVNSLVEYIKELYQKYNLTVAIGYPKGIRMNNQKGNGKKQLRKVVHKWSYYLFLETLRNKMAEAGFDKRVLIDLGEAWTSIMCYKCNRRGSRPVQSVFICKYCGTWNADLNGAANIAKRGIMYRKLVPETQYGKHNTLGMYLKPNRPKPPKTP